MVFWDQLFEASDISEQNGEIEMIEDTKIHGFEGTQEIDNKEIADYLRETVPSEHLDSCPEIVYDPKEDAFQDPNCLGVCYLDSNRIAIASEERFEDYDSMLDVLTHEVGHNEHSLIEKLDSDTAAKWEELYSASMENYNGLGFVSDYAMTDCHEDFAESYMTYIRDPELLKVMSPEKYTFMKYNVFDGREYGQAMLNNGIYVSMDQYMADVLKNAAEQSGNSTDFEPTYSIQTSGDVSMVSKTYRCFSMIA